MKIFSINKNNSFLNMGNKFNINLKLILFFQFIKIILNECDRSTPIKLKNNNCVNEYCSQQEKLLNECFIDNSIIKMQYPNDLIIFGEVDHTYVNYVTFSNGDLLIETSAFPGNPKRIFYGIKNNGKYYLKNDNNEEVPFYSLTNFSLLTIRISF